MVFTIYIYILYIYIYVYVADLFNPTYKIGCCNWIESNLVTKYATGSMFGFMKHIVWSFVISH